MKFADQLKSERKRLGITQAQAASLLGISKSAVSKWEIVDRTPMPLTQEASLLRLRALTAIFPSSRASLFAKNCNAPAHLPSKAE